MDMAMAMFIAHLEFELGHAWPARVLALSLAPTDSIIKSQGPGGKCNHYSPDLHSYYTAQKRITLCLAATETEQVLRLYSKKKMSKPGGPRGPYPPPRPPSPGPGVPPAA